MEDENGVVMAASRRVRDGREDAALSARGSRRGLMGTLRRLSGLGALVFAVVLLVGTARVHAISQVLGDDDLCFAMGFAGLGKTALPVDPADLADGNHACCDLGLCLDASALPPIEPPFAAPRRIVRRRTRRVVAGSPSCRRRDAANRPRGPPIP
ncbi:MAG: hypothetical protein OEL76_02785 [Siculibacillus sp.]|nr:hypothetical protein [Siculibacillus sp.]